MGSPLTLPGPLADFLNMLGYTWPKSDEFKMFDLGGKWMNLGGDLQQAHTKGQAPVEDVTGKNQGLDIEAFMKQVKNPERGPQVISDGSQGANVVGVGLYIAAGLVLALKIAVIVQLVLLAFQIASAIASAVATFGASLAWIPIAKKIAGIAIEFLIGKVIESVLA